MQIHFVMCINKATACKEKDHLCVTPELETRANWEKFQEQIQLNRRHNYLKIRAIKMQMSAIK